MVRRFVDGVELDRDDPVQLQEAGMTLAVLHHALAGELRERPTRSPWHERSGPGDSDPPALRDPKLDAWQTAFTRAADKSLTRGAVHGDFWSGNILCADGRVAAVIDWAEARVDVQARELAWASWEFGHDPPTRKLDIDRTRTSLAGYRAVSGRWQPGLADVLIPLMRIELRLHARYSLTDSGDHAYGDALVREFVRLRCQHPIELLS
jgi:Ser/Thr protein kinase RdoA (MazF antagonist)